MRGLLTAAALLTLPFVALGADPPVPDWVRQVMAQPVPAYPASVKNVVLLREETVTVGRDGSRVMHERGVMKAIRPSGDGLSAERTYNVKNGRIRDFQGWQIPPSGKSIWYGPKAVLDLALSRNDVYDEARAKKIDCGSVPPETVFAWDVTEEEKTIFTQYLYLFQFDEPVMKSRFSLIIPDSWEVKSALFNHAPVEPRTSGTTWTWELSNLSAVEDEPYSPSFSEMAPRLAVGYFPPEGNAAGLRGLRDWAAVSAWLGPLVDPASEVTDPVRNKATALVQGAASPLDQIRAIGRFVQQTNYVEVAMNLTRGGGYAPHKASETLARNYGDCKDKAALMKALLKAVGIDSYVTVISATDRDFVREEWASPSQFNHAIIAISVPDSIDLPTVLNHPTLGRLLIFDPTDSVTEPGSLPAEEQGSLALILAGARGTLSRMPLADVQTNRVESETEATLNVNGSLSAKMRREYFGQSSVPLRGIEKFGGKERLQRRFERGLNAAISGTTLNEFTTEAAKNDNHVTVKMDVSASRFGQTLQGKLLIIRPGLLASGGGDYYLGRDKRATPVKLKADLREDTIRVKLPEGFQPDEVPRPAKIDGPYGRIEASWQVKDGELVMTQRLEVKPRLVPVEEYEDVRRFFDRMNGATGAPVVFAKK